VDRTFGLSSFLEPVPVYKLLIPLLSIVRAHHRLNAAAEPLELTADSSDSCLPLERAVQCRNCCRWHNGSPRWTPSQADNIFGHPCGHRDSVGGCRIRALVFFRTLGESLRRASRRMPLSKKPQTRCCKQSESSLPCESPVTRLCSPACSVRHAVSVRLARSRGVDGAHH